MNKTMNQCINEDTSLSELYHQRKVLTREINQCSDTDRLGLSKKLEDVLSKIRVVEHIGFNGGGIIRLM